MIHGQLLHAEVRSALSGLPGRGCLMKPGYCTDDASQCITKMHLLLLLLYSNSKCLFFTNCLNY